MPRHPRELRPHESVRAFFGAELRHWRTARGRSQDELGRLTLHSGGAISKVEKAERWPTEEPAQRCDMVLDTGGALKRLLPVVLAERRAAGLGSEIDKAHVTARRRGLPPLDFGAVRRPDAQECVVDAVLAAAHVSQSGPVVIGGPGGYGKSTLALQACSDERVLHAFDEMVWVELGQECTAARVVMLIGDLCEQLNGARPVLLNREQAGFRLAEALAERRVLIVLDNVWSAGDLAPFLLGGPNCARLVTTRDLGICRSRSTMLRMPPMTEREVVKLLENNSPVALGDDPGVRTLASLCGGWPLLASVVGASVAHDISAGAAETVAVNHAVSALREDGAHALDVWDASRREGTISRVVASSLLHLDTHVSVHGGSELGDRYLDLAIFPGAVPIPVSVLAAWWREHGWTTTAVRQFARVLAERSLLGSYLADEDAVVLHDVFRSSLIALARRPAVKAHKSLVDAFRTAAPDGWHRLGPEERYVWHHLTHHLDQAGRGEEVVDVLADPRFIANKLRSVGHDPLINDAVVLERVAQRANDERVGTARTLVDAAYLAADAIRPDDIHSTLLVALGWAGRLQSDAADELRSWRDDAFDVRWARPLKPEDGNGHTGAVTAVAVASNRVISAAEDGSVRVWDRVSRRLVRVLRGHHGWVYTVAISASADVIASAGDDAVIRLWSASSGKPIGVLTWHTKRIRSLAFDRSGRLLVSGAEDGAIIVWSVAPVARVRDLATDGRPTWSVAVGHQDSIVAAGGEDETVRLYDIGSGRLVAERSGHRDWVRAVAFAADVPLLASGSGDGDVCLWSVADGNLTLLRTTRVGDPVRALAVSPDAGRVDSAGEDATVRTITAEGVVQEASMPAAVDWVRCIAAADDQLVIGCEDGGVRLLRDERLIELASGRDTVWSTALTADGKFALLGHSDGTIELNRAGTNTPEKRLDAGGGRVWALHTAADVIAAACGDGAVRVWNLDEPSWSITLNQDEPRAWAVAVDPTGRTVAASSGAGTVQMWDLRTGELRWRQDAHAGRVRSIAFDPTGRVLVTGGGDGAARTWDAGTGIRISEFRSPAGWVRAVAVDDNGTRVAAGLGSGDISLRNVDIDAQPVHLFGHGGRILALEFAADDRLLSAAADGTVRLWSISDQRQLAQVRVDASLQCACVHRESGSVLASSSSGVIALELKRVARSRDE